MENLVYFFFTIFVINVLNLTDILCLDPQDISKEKEFLIKIETLLKERRSQIKKIEDEYSLTQVLNSADNFCYSPISIKQSEFDNSNPSCVKLIKPTDSSNTRIKIMGILNLPHILITEATINFFIINLYKNNLSNHNQDNQNTKNFLILFLTQNSIIITNSEGKSLTQQSLNLKIKIAKADFSLFGEDNSIILYSSNSEISIITVELKISLYNSNSVDSVDLFISSIKYTIINANLNIIGVTSNIFNANKYIVASHENGEVIVMNKDLETISSIHLHRKIKSVMINNGIIGVISESNIIFINLLGGNSILLMCYTYYDIIDSVYDNLNNLLYVIDDRRNLLIYEIKLSISRQSYNECHVIFRIKLRCDVNSRKAKMLLVKNSLYIFIGSVYGAVIDLANIQVIGINNALTEYFLIPSVNNKDIYKDEDMIVGIIADKNYKNYTRNKSIYEKLTNYILIYYRPGLLMLVELVSINKNYIENNKNLISGSIWINLFNHLSKHIFFVYMIIIFIITFGIIYYRRFYSNSKQSIQHDSTPNTNRHFTKEEENILQEILKNMKNLNTHISEDKEKDNNSINFNRNLINKNNN